MNKNFNISFTVKSIDVENNSVVVQPFSDILKYTPEYYPSININLTSLIPDLDINLQIAEYCKQNVLFYHLKENIKQNKKIVSLLEKNKNKTITFTNKEVEVFAKNKTKYELQQSFKKEFELFEEDKINLEKTILNQSNINFL
jgi:hypothetical protein